MNRLDEIKKVIEQIHKISETAKFRTGGYEYMCQVLYGELSVSVFDEECTDGYELKATFVFDKNFNEASMHKEEDLSVKQINNMVKAIKDWLNEEIEE